MKTCLLLIVALTLPFLTVTEVAALQSDSDILIIELQVRSNAAVGAADQEFAVLYNTSDQPVNMSTWKLQYKSATGSTWNDKAMLRGNLAAHGHYLLVSDKYPDPPTDVPDSSALALDTFSAGLSDSGGHIRIIDSAVPEIPVVHDLLGWGSSANAAEGNAPAPAPAGGKSLKRKLTTGGEFIDTDNNGADFEVSSEPTPRADPFYIAPVINTEPDQELPAEQSPPQPEPGLSEPDQPPETSNEEVVPEISQPAVSPLQPLITELLPNPAPPASDSTDEFIEIYNPNDEPLSLEGYKLQSGNTFNYSYSFSSATNLQPHEYRAFLITTTGAVLANSGGQARLLDAQGSVVAQTNEYEAADEGQAWALINGAWQWTTSPTPSEQNILTLTLPKPLGVVKPAASKKTTTASSAKKTTAAKAPAAAKTAAVKAAKTQPAPTDRQIYEDPASLPPRIHPGILVGVGVITLLYAGYEYRYDAVNTIRRFRRYRELRRTARAQSSGR